MRKLLLLLAVSLCATTAHADWQIQTGNSVYPTTSAVWDIVQTPRLQLPQVTADQQSLPLQHLHLFLKNGKNGQMLSLSMPNQQAKNGAIYGAGSSQTAGNISVTQQLHPLAPQNNALVWKIEFVNNGTQEQWIETGLTGEISDAAKLRFWDGYELQDVKNQTIERSTPDMAFPATMIQDSTQKNALVIALHPDNDISWITASLNPQNKTYFYGGRFVIPAKQKITLTYVLYTLQPHFGELDAIDGYYQRFPASFTAIANSDPRLTGFRGVNSSYVVRNVVAPNGAALDARTLDGLAKAYAGWEWGYNPYKFSGDWYGRAESWNLPLSQGDQASLETYEKSRSSFNLQDIEQFHRDRINLFQKADLRANTDMAFYILDFVQTELAQKNDWMKYTYGYYTADDPTSGRIKHWVAPYDDTWHIFPWATPFGDSYKRDLPDVLKELDTSSFAIDVYADSSPYRGPTTEYIPGWSYDGKGTFINTGLAYKRLVEFIHTLHKDNSTASVVANLSPWEVDPALKIENRKKEIPNYSAIFAPDAYIVEGDVSEQIDYDQPGRLFPKRYLFGKKYISSVGGAYHDQIGERIPWQTMSPNQIRAAYAKYLKKRLMAYYQGGLLPNYDDARGIKLLLDAIPNLLEIESRGFTAAPASTGDKNLQRRRYGDGLGAAMVYSNPTSNDVNSQESLLNDYFQNEANSVVLPFEDIKDAIDFSCNNHSNTTFSLDVPTMENRIALLPLSLQFSQPQALTGTTSVQLLAHQQTYSAEIQLKQASKAVLRVQPPRDFVLESVQLNGQNIQTGANESVALQLTAGTNQLRVFFASTRFLSPEENLYGFNWKQFQIVVTGANSDRQQAAAQFLADYATYYQKFTPAIAAKTAFDASSAATPTVVIATDAAKRGVWLDAAHPNVLFITGRDDFDTQQLAWDLCRLLDRQSPLMPSATFTDPLTKAMLDRIGLMVDAGKSAVAKPITAKSLQAVPGEDEAPAGNNGDLSSLDFKEIPPLPRQGWTATASSSYVDPGSPIAPSKALDDTPGTRWTPGRGKAGDWFMVDIGKMQEFNHVQLKSPYPYKYFPRHYKAELSDDGITWRAAVTGEGAKDTDIFWPAMQTARYIRITLTQDQDVFWSIDEIFVYKRAVPQSTAAVAPPLETLPHLDIPFLTGAVSLDGNLDEPVWQKAASMDNFSPLKDHPITQPTQVKIFHDAANFYIGIICHEANMNKLWEPATQRDGAVWSGDDVEIYLAPGDHAGQLKFPYYQLLFSPSGLQADLSLNAQDREDLKWDADWQVKTHKGADYWSAEVRIPFAALQGQNAAVWRANIGRMETPNGDTSTWAPMQRVFAQPSLFGVWTIENK